MKITIDTQVDTHEDIRKVLHILTSILDKRENSHFTNSSSISLSSSSFGSSLNSSSPNSFSQAEDTSSMMNMFAQEGAAGAVPKKEIPDTPPDFSSYLNLTRSSQKKEDNEIPKVEFF